MESDQPTTAQSPEPTPNICPGLNRLPEEVVRMIAINLRDLYDLKSLATVDQRTYNICCPFLWENLRIWELDVRPLLSTSTLTEVVLPKHGRHVLSSDLALWHDCDQSNFNRLKSGPVALNTSRSESPGSRGPVTQKDLIKILSYCQNLRRLVLHFVTFGNSPRSLKTFEVHLQGLISHLARLQRLRHLDLRFHEELCISPRTVAKLLSELPLLESLELSCINPKYPKDEGNNVLGQAISSIKQLAKLILYQVSYLDATWPPCLALEDLEMLECETGHPVRLNAPRFINTFAPNVRRLELDYYGGGWYEPDENLTVESHHFHLPRLVEVKFSDFSDFSLIDCFKHCVDLQHIHYCVMGRKQFSGFVEFICASLWPRLEELHLVQGDYDEEEPARNYAQSRNRLRSYCRAHNIKYRGHDIKLGYI